mmetsp:Transcript_75039/g.216925  ORF Transcript_75039/g.216925 Transcript_75039/m.216925 type:complete len:281 (+) Transcript_75039:308-1150(+)
MGTRAHVQRDEGRARPRAGNRLELGALHGQLSCAGGLRAQPDGFAKRRPHPVRGCLGAILPARADREAPGGGRRLPHRLDEQHLGQQRREQFPGFFGHAGLQRRLLGRAGLFGGAQLARCRRSPRLGRRLLGRVGLFRRPQLARRRRLVRRLLRRLGWRRASAARLRHVGAPGSAEFRGAADPSGPLAPAGHRRGAGALLADVLCAAAAGHGTDRADRPWPNRTVPVGCGCAGSAGGNQHPQLGHIRFRLGQSQRPAHRVAACGPRALRRRARPVSALGG